MTECPRCRATLHAQLGTDGHFCEPVASAVVTWDNQALRASRKMLLDMGLLVQQVLVPFERGEDVRQQLRALQDYWEERSFDWADEMDALHEMEVSRPPE